MYLNTSYIRKYPSQIVKACCSDLSLCFSVWILCAVVTGGWVWSSGPCLRSHRYRYNGALVSRRVFVHTTPGVSASQQRESSWPQDIVPGKESKNSQQCILHLSELLSQCAHSSGFFVLHGQTWPVFQTMSGNWDGRPGYFPPHQITDGSIAHIDYILFLWAADADCCFSWWESRQAVERVWHG